MAAGPTESNKHCTGPTEIQSTGVLIYLPLKLPPPAPWSLAAACFAALVGAWLPLKIHLAFRKDLWAACGACFVHAPLL